MNDEIVQAKKTRKPRTARLNKVIGQPSHAVVKVLDGRGKQVAQFTVYQPVSNVIRWVEVGLENGVNVTDAIDPDIKVPMP